MPRSVSAWPRRLFVAYLLVWASLGISPLDRPTWLLENVLVVLCVAWLVRTHRRSAFSVTTCFGMFVFFVLHAIGSHFTYSEVPYDAWLRALTGYSLEADLGVRRNHFDRAVHLAYGLLMAPMIDEVVRRGNSTRGASWAILVPLSLVMATSMLYEVIEWLAALVFGGDTGAAYLGTQGDPWDAQKDMLLATLGGLSTLSLRAASRRRRPIATAGA